MDIFQLNVYSRTQYAGLVCKVSLHEIRDLIFAIDHTKKGARRLHKPIFHYIQSKSEFTSSRPPQGLETSLKNPKSRYLVLHSVSYHT